VQFTQRLISELEVHYFRSLRRLQKAVVKVGVLGENHQVYPHGVLPDGSIGHAGIQVGHIPKIGVIEETEAFGQIDIHQKSEVCHSLGR